MQEVQRLEPAREAEPRVEPFVELDSALTGHVSGLWWVRTVTPEAHEALARHLERRLLATGREVARAATGALDSGFRDLAPRLGLAELPEDVEEAAALIGARLGARSGTALVAVGGCVWDRTLASRLPTHLGGGFVVVLGSHGEPVTTAARSFELGAGLESEGVARFWQAAARQLAGNGPASLAALEARLFALRAPGASASRELSPAARAFLRRLALSHRSWPLAEAERLSAEGLEEALAAGAVEVRDGLISVIAAPDEAHEPFEAVHVARALLGVFPSDPFALARAAELFLAGGEHQSGAQAMRAALLGASDPTTRVGFWERHAAALVATGADGLAWRLAGAELALELGDVEVAVAWAEAAARHGSRHRAALLMGRAAMARGDLVTAQAALARARDAAVTPEERWESLVELGEVAYSRGELEVARQLAVAVQEAGGPLALQLAARNLEGKLLLCASRWVEAEAHFAADACRAALGGLFTAELRARVNRAIALISRGSTEEARPILESVLADAEGRGELRAMGFALSNLAVLAIERHEYARALEFSERAIAIRRRLGDRLGFTRDVTNLVELRLRLGLVDHAEQALRFGRHALGPGAPPSRVAELGLAAARVHLARRQPGEAERELRGALRAASFASDGDKLAECHRFAARLALESGEVSLAEEALARARELATTPYALAEVTLLQALVDQARGSITLERCQAAVVAAIEAGDEELTREAHVLTVVVALAQGEASRAASHLAAATALRDEVTRGLPVRLREAYLARPDLVRLARLEHSTAASEEQEPVSVLPSVRAPRGAGEVFVGRHPAVRAVQAAVRRVAPTQATVLIHGESGTGKELVAEAVHQASRRAGGPLVKVNCSALVESLLLSELFGHEKGAFTGAASRRRGRFERAHGGTLFLDEIGDISPRTQVALLRVLEERRIERVGGSASIPVDVRIVCATHRDLPAMVARGEFREDLYYRLAGFTVEVPSLRDRLSDLPLLCEHLLQRIAAERAEEPKQLTDAALALLARHRWPGNVRELDNALRAASLFADGPLLDAHHLIGQVAALRQVASTPVSARPPEARLGSFAPGASDDAAAGAPGLAASAYLCIRDSGTSLGELKRALEQECIVRALAETGGNITRAAALLGMKRPRLSQLVKQYELLGVNEEDEP